jgi:hypothetical protein
MAFAETTSLRIRGYRASDLDKIVALFNDPRTQRGDPGYVVPGSETKGRKEVEEFVPQLLMFCVLEAKTPLDDGSDWVGVCTLKNRGSPKNRNSMFGICLDVKFWGRGYGKTFSPFIMLFVEYRDWNSSGGHALAGRPCFRSTRATSRLSWRLIRQPARHLGLQKDVRARQILLVSI